MVVLSFAFVALPDIGFGRDIEEGDSEYWSGVVYLDEIVFVYGNLTIAAGTEVIATHTSARIWAMNTGALYVLGTQQNPVHLHGLNGASWHGIWVSDNYPSGLISVVSHALIEDAWWGVVCDLRSFCYISNTTFSECTIGTVCFQGWNTTDYDVRYFSCTAENCGQGFSMWNSIVAQDCLAYECDLGYRLHGDDGIATQNFYNNQASYCTTGIFVHEDSDTVNIGPYAEVDNCTTCGIEVKGLAYIFESRIHSNDGNGIWVLDYGSVDVADTEISSNYNNVVLDSANGHVELGLATSSDTGNNKITDPVRYHVINRSGNTLFAENCYWGGKPGSLPVLNLIGDVDVTPFLINEPF